MTFKDRQYMPYTEATILECLRVGNIVPTALPHAVDEDVIIEGMVRDDDANTFQKCYDMQITA